MGSERAVRYSEHVMLRFATEHLCIRVGNGVVSELHLVNMEPDGCAESVW